MNISKKRFTNALGLQMLFPICAISLSACAPVISEYTSATHAASVAQAQRTGVQSMGSDRTGSDVTKDQNLASDVNTAILGKVPTGNNHVVCYNKKILILGQVPTKADIAKVTAAASNTPGVTKVWNYSTVGPNETIEQISSDGYLASMTRKRLVDREMAHLDVNASNIATAASKGVVYLIGSNAGNQQAIEEVMNGMKQTDGVQKVVNLIDQ